MNQGEGVDLMCLYCKGSGKFRHERPRVTDHMWLQMTAGTMRCPLCKGTGKFTAKLTDKLVETGLIFVRTKEGLILTGCPEVSCVKWVDATEFFKARKDFVGKCPLGHEITMSIDKPPRNN